MKFLADECIYTATVKHLKDLGHDIITVKELGLESSSDEKILNSSTKKGRFGLHPSNWTKYVRVTDRI